MRATFSHKGRREVTPVRPAQSYFAACSVSPSVAAISV
jgi:hypothetical protein